MKTKNINATTFEMNHKTLNGNQIGNVMILTNVINIQSSNLGERMQDPIYQAAQATMRSDNQR